MKPNLREQHVGNTSDDNPRCLRSRKEIDRQSGSGPTDAVCLWLAVMWRCRSRVKLLEAQRKHRRKRVTARRCGDGKRAEEGSHGGINAPPSDPSSASSGKGTRAGPPAIRINYAISSSGGRSTVAIAGTAAAVRRRGGGRGKNGDDFDVRIRHFGTHARPAPSVTPSLARSRGRTESGHRESPWQARMQKKQCNQRDGHSIRASVRGWVNIMLTVLQPSAPLLSVDLAASKP